MADKLFQVGDGSTLQRFKDMGDGTHAPVTVSGGRSAGTLDLGTFTAISTGTPVSAPVGSKVVRVKLTGTGAISATINIYGSTENTAANGELLGVLSPSGTTVATDGVPLTESWPYIWADCPAIAGTGASAAVTLGG